MRRIELWLGLVVLGFVGFVATQIARRPSRQPSPVAPAAVDDTIQQLADDRVASGAPMDPNVRVATSSLPAPQRDTAEITRVLREGAPGTYVDEILLLRGGYLARWTDRRFEPLRVWVQPTTPLADFDVAMVEQTRNAFGEWAPADVPVSFTFVVDSARADVRVVWVDRLDNASGRTRWTRDQHWWIIGADIELGLHQPDGTPLGVTAVHAVALHEVGHLLGLDHTSDARNIMSPVVKVAALSPTDIATARLIYRLPPGRAR